MLLYSVFMNDIISYFSTIPSSHRSLILMGGITFFWMIENTFPLFRMQYRKWQHAGINFFLTFTTIIVNFVLAFILIKTAGWAVENHFGILQWLPSLPLWLYTLTGLLLLDLIGAYLAHYVQHRLKFLWRFHLVHHTDTWIDTTSANRHYPVFLYNTRSLNRWKSHVDGFSLSDPICCFNTIYTCEPFFASETGYYFELFYCFTQHA